MMNEGDPKAYRLEISLGNNPETTATYRLFAHIDRLCEERATANPKEFLNRKQFSRELFEERYKSPCIRFAKNRETGEIRDGFPPFIRVAVPIKQGTQVFDVFGFFSADKRPLEVTPVNAQQMISRNDQVRTVLSLDKIWVSGLGFGCKVGFPPPGIRFDEEFELTFLFRSASSRPGFTRPHSGLTWT